MYKWLYVLEKNNNKFEDSCKFLIYEKEILTAFYFIYCSYADSKYEIQKISEKLNVYSFDVVLLELISQKNPHSRSS